MNSAPPFDCWHCGRRIGRTRTHYLLRGVLAQVCCVRCIDKHDAYDAVAHSGTRAGIAAQLGMWP